jgi:hypothetical protein
VGINTWTHSLWATSFKKVPIHLQDLKFHFRARPKLLVVMAKSVDHQLVHD